ncbi:MAG: RNA polymerase sigma factor [Bacteroidales bacterium]|nr:RNA polymerase sigma factor [Bacteroidales bacterium]
MASEKEIIKGCIRKSKKYQKLLFDKYAPVLLPLCMRYSHNRATAEDILQEGFMKIFDNLKKFRYEGSLEGWMKRIMVNTALNHYRANLKHFYHKDVEDYSESIPSQDTISDNLEVQDILAVVQKLPPGYRSVFNMFDIEGYSHKEIAEKMGISENTSKTQLLKARKLLRKMLLDYEK